MQIVWMILSAMGILTGLVAVHEYGHYLAAKKRGINVAQFAIGVGPKLIKWHRGETEFSIRPFLIGGYVMFSDDVEGEPSPGDFRTAPLASRAITAAAGPIMNVIAALVLAVIMILVSPEFHAVRIAAVDPGSPAEAAGIQEGDILKSLDGVEMDFFVPALQEYQSQPRGESVEVRAERDGVPYETTVTLEDQNAEAPMGIRMEPAPHSFFDAIGLSFRWIGEQATLIFRTLGDLFFRGSGVENMTGIVGTTAVVGTVVQYGNFGMILMLVAVISINLAIINLLPFPALDGGKLIMYAIEGVSKKAVPAKIEGILNFAGMALIMAFAGFLVYQDIVRLVA